MAVTPLKILLFLGGLTTAAVGTAYVSGALDPLFGPKASETAPQAKVAPEPVAPVQPAPAPAQEQQQAAVPPAASPPVAQAPVAETAEPLPPSFDIVRVEPDGSIVIAGKASPNSEVEILSGSKVLGKVTATPEGDFAAALDDPLKPGDYQIVLRSTTTARIVANSKETAIVSVPETADGQVLALVEKPGAPSRLITKPVVPEPSAAGGSPSAPAASEQTPQSPAPTKPSDEAAAPVQPAQPAVSQQKTSRPAPAANIAVDAVEIEGRKVFVAGSSDPGTTVRIYANEILLGDAKTSPEGRFLIETERDLPVGDYVVRADVLGPDGAKVIARAAVPFSREPGENISAVAPQQPSSAAVEKPADPAAPASGAAEEAQGDGQPDGSIAANEVDKKPEAQTQEDQSSALAPKLEAVDGSVIIRRGDTLWHISKRVYGRGVRYSTIYLANQEQIKDPDMIWPGQVFRVPDKTEEGEKADLKAIESPSAPEQ
ncbi:MAG: LysM peptidoglycan-binding domain-containing protein [Rhizobiaceae bacterium]|nr:LysM peptidoglycan-binding domain-containing protein [Rhizobiaceae bacterium]